MLGFSVLGSPGILRHLAAAVTGAHAVLVQELASQQARRVVRDAPQPLVRRLPGFERRRVRRRFAARSGLAVGGLAVAAGCAGSRAVGLRLSGLGSGPVVLGGPIFAGAAAGGIGFGRRGCLLAVVPAAGSLLGTGALLGTGIRSGPGLGLGALGTVTAAAAGAARLVHAGPIAAGVGLRAGFQNTALPACAKPSTATSEVARIAPQMSHIWPMSRVASRIRSLPMKPESGGSPAVAMAATNHSDVTIPCCAMRGPGTSASIDLR